MVVCAGAMAILRLTIPRGFFESLGPALFGLDVCRDEPQHRLRVITQCRYRHHATRKQRPRVVFPRLEDPFQVLENESRQAHAKLPKSVSRVRGPVGPIDSPLHWQRRKVVNRFNSTLLHSASNGGAT